MRHLCRRDESIISEHVAMWHHIPLVAGALSNIQWSVVVGYCYLTITIISTEILKFQRLLNFLPKNSAINTMASSTLSPATASQLCSSKSGMFSPSRALLGKPTRTDMVTNYKGMRIKCQATSIPADRVPDMGKRELLNLLLLGALSLPTGFMLVPYAAFFAPPGLGSAGGGTTAKDALGNDVIADEWLKTHGPGDRTLTQGLKGDPTYLVVEKGRTLASFGINAVCTHLGCVVPWNQAENKFICPCHGSQYNDQGTVVRGPAPLSLALAHANIENGKVVFVPWTETDFRTGDAPWWA